MEFSISRLPRVEFGAGKLARLPELVARFGNKALLVTGKKSFKETVYWSGLKKQLTQAQIKFQTLTIDNEPSPQMVDDAVKTFSAFDIDIVVGIGGGSVLDAAKAIAGLLRVQRSVMDFLEGVGPELQYTGPSTPFIAVPTTAGTGSEATKNAVLSVSGTKGFKKSFRDEQLMAEYAVLDPQLLTSCTPSLVAANGMDAVTQLIESYVSIKANPFTDALALDGLCRAKNALFVCFEQKGDKEQAQADMLYAAWLSGITLAQVGLGSVHGLASPLGAFYPIPHGIVCGTLLGAATQVNIEAMQSREPKNMALSRYCTLAEVLHGRHFARADDGLAALIDLLHQWVERLELPRLSQYGLTEESLAHVVKNARGSSMKTNPIVLTDEEIIQVLTMRL